MGKKTTGKNIYRKDRKNSDPGLLPRVWKAVGKFTGRSPLFAAVLLFLVLATTGAGLFAKYVSDRRKEAEMTSSQFHITSNYLEEGTSLTGVPDSSYSITGWTNGFSILLYNYEKENVAQISAEEISYTVKVLVNGSQTAGSWYCTGAQLPGWTSDGKGGGTATFPVNASAASQTLRIRPGTGSAAGDQVDVFVTTTAPFKKELCARFEISTKTTPDYTFLDQGDGTVLLTIHTNDYTSDILVKWNSADYEPDNTNPVMQSWQNGTGTNSYTLSGVSDNYTYELLFFKKGTGTVKEISDGSGTSILLETE